MKCFLIKIGTNKYPGHTLAVRSLRRHRCHGDMVLSMFSFICLLSDAERLYDNFYRKQNVAPVLFYYVFFFFCKLFVQDENTAHQQIWLNNVLLASRSTLNRWLRLINIQTACVASKERVGAWPLDRTMKSDTDACCPDDDGPKASVSAAPCLRFLRKPI